jgi:hypothetical protein
LYYKIFASQSIDWRNTLFHWQSYQFKILVSWRTITMILCTHLFYNYSKIFEWKSVDRRNTLFHWQSCQFRNIVSCGTNPKSYEIMLKILWQMILILFLILFQDIWMEISWQEKYPLLLAILSIYKYCKLKNNDQVIMIIDHWSISDFISRDLNRNQFTGEIPSSIGNIANLIGL